MVSEAIPILYDKETTPRQWDINFSEDTHVYAHLAVIVNCNFSKDKRFSYTWYAYTFAFCL